MTLFEKLLSFVNPLVFDKKSNGFIAFRIQHRSESFNWGVSDRVLTGYDGDDLLFSVALEGYTLRSLINYLSTLDGIEASDPASQTLLGVSAATLVDGAGAQSDSNGNALYAYTSLLWMYLDVLSDELAKAKAAIVAAIDQISVKTADEDWLDEWGGYFGVSRTDGESDSTYSSRIVVEVIRPRGNNKAIEIAILDRFGQDSTVSDLTKWRDKTQIYDSTFVHDGKIKYDALNTPTYGLFEVVINYDLESGADLLAYAAQVRAFIEKFRDAGTQMESLSLSSSELNDTHPGALSDAYSLGAVASLSDTSTGSTDTSLSLMSALATLADTATAGSDSATISAAYTTTYNSLRTYSGAVPYNSGGVVAEVL